MTEPEMDNDPAVLLANLLQILAVERAKVKASGQKPSEIFDDLKIAVLRLISN